MRTRIVALFILRYLEPHFFVSQESSRNESEEGGINCLQSAFSVRYVAYKILSQRVRQHSYPICMSSTACFFRGNGEHYERETDCKQPRGGQEVNWPTQRLFYKVKLLLFENKTPKVLWLQPWDCIFVRFKLISFHFHTPFVPFLGQVRVESLASSYR